MSLIPWILLGLICLVHLIFIPKLIRRSVGTAWHGYVPFLNSIAILKITGRPWYWSLFLLVPGINLLMLTIMHVELGIAFGKRSTKDQYFFGVLPWIAIAKLAQGDDEYLGPRDWTGKKKGQIREWGEAILWAVIVASVFRTYAMETFTIPTGSMEGSMLVGDYLIVDKTTYGAKLPETPFSIPLVHNRIPGTMTPSYTSWFTLPYTRLPGFRDIERGDAVVFNYPPGDTAIVDPYYAGHNYYQLLRDGGENKNGVFKPKSSALRVAYSHLKKTGQINDSIQASPYKEFCDNPEKYLATSRTWWSKAYGIKGGIPIDKKENYVKRCIGLPGDTISIVDRQVYIDGVAIDNPENLQFMYDVILKSKNDFNSIKSELNLTKLDSLKSMDSQEGMVYTILLTNSEVEKLNKTGLAVSIENKSTENRKATLSMYPNVYNEEFNEWTPDNMGPIFIPNTGAQVELNERNIALYKRVISVYEGHDFEENDAGVFIDGVLATEYKFEQDYYWMMGDNRHNSADSRMWGFVPFDHVVGRASYIWFSKQNEAQHGESKIRWDRMFKSVK
ncbi:MAG: hypothetical protein CL823_00130 [Crocinitomicaceae bacterium]|nr:hypothetical protein [Crocinitomicaceae bacterium]|tara:strand:+ start:1052 stop:2731 length:1680 start_codon:yes stop_codon:yes gene_type:complete